jgi:restriction system protein
MTRSFFSLALQAARAAERAERAQAREQIRKERDSERTMRARERLNKQTYFESRVAEVEDMNRALGEACNALETILADGLARWIGVNWLGLRRKIDPTEFDKNPQLRVVTRPSLDAHLPEKPGFFERLIPGWSQRYDQKMVEARRKFQRLEDDYLASLEVRRRYMMKLEAETKEYNEQLDAFHQAYRNGEPEAVAGFFDLVFEHSDFPDGFPAKWKVCYISDSKQLIVDFDLPNVDEVVPKTERCKYVKTSDQITETKKTQKNRQAVYSSLVAQSVLRRLYEVYQSDREEVVSVATISAFVDAIDPSSGQRVRPCLVSVRTTREDFQKLELRHVDPLACLKRLNATVSRNPSELAAVKPIIDINMVDPRFIQETDVMSMLDTRPNLMELSPGEFENLITNLFQKMGLETKLTQASRDGGVDCIAFDNRPVLGGKVVVQAKRYKNTVGVSAVRDLYGTMHNEGATKGILVTTSGYGTAAYEFANGKPLELMSGSNLIYLLKEHAGIEAKIVMPDDWQDQQMNV